jgi:hypothetical protein
MPTCGRSAFSIDAVLTRINSIPRGASAARNSTQNCSIARSTPTGTQWKASTTPLPLGKSGDACAAAMPGSGSIFMSFEL